MSRCRFVFIYSAQYLVWFFLLKTIPWIVEVSQWDEFMAASTKAHWALLNKVFPCYFLSSWISFSLDSANIQATPMPGTRPGALISQDFLFTFGLRWGGGLLHSHSCGWWQNIFCLDQGFVVSISLPQVSHSLDFWSLVGGRALSGQHLVSSLPGEQ